MLKIKVLKALIWIVEKFSKSKKREPVLSLTEQFILKLPAHKREIAKEKLAEAERLGRQKCPDCGLISGVFNITFHNVEKGTKQVCQKCKLDYKE